MGGLLVLVIFFALMWVLFIVPQQRRVKAQQAFVAALSVGDEVVTAGGIHGTIVELDDDTVRLDVGSGTVLTLARPAIHRSQHEPTPEATPDERSEEQPAVDAGTTPDAVPESGDDASDGDGAAAGRSRWPRRRGSAPEAAVPGGDDADEDAS